MGFWASGFAASQQQGGTRSPEQSPPLRVRLRNWRWQIVAAVKQQCTVVKQVVADRPAIAWGPLLLCLALIAGGVAAVIESNKAAENIKRSQAKVQGGCEANLLRTGFHQILSPAASLATIISYQPEASALLNNWSNILNLIARYASPDVRGVVGGLSLLPFGVLRAYTPLLPQHPNPTLGLDLLSLNNSLRASALQHIKQGTPFMMGPMNSSYAVATNSSGQPTSGYLIRVLLPVYIPGCTAGSLYGQPQGPTACGVAEGCFTPLSNTSAPNTNTTLGTCFWGFAGADITLASLFTGTTPVPPITVDSGTFNFRITATFLGKPPVVVRQSTYDDLDAAEVISLNLTEYESSAETFATQWEIQVEPVGGWQSAWRDGLIAFVVVLSVIICSLLFALLVYVHQHRMLLFSLLPKTAIRRMGGTTALFAEDKELGLMLQGTPAERMLALLSEVLEGGTPRVQDIMYLRAALLTNTNLYQPMDLHRQLQAMDMEDDVARAIMRELQGVTLRSQYPGGMATAGSAGVGSGGGGYNAMYNEPHTRRNSQVSAGTPHGDAPPDTPDLYGNLTSALSALVSSPPGPIVSSLQGAPSYLGVGGSAFFPIPKGGLQSLEGPGDPGSMTAAAAVRLLSRSGSLSLGTAGSAALRQAALAHLSLTGGTPHAPPASPGAVLGAGSSLASSPPLLSPTSPASGFGGSNSPGGMAVGAGVTGPGSNTGVGATSNHPAGSNLTITVPGSTLPPIGRILTARPSALRNSSSALTPPRGSASANTTIAPAMAAAAAAALASSSASGGIPPGGGPSEKEGALAGALAAGAKGLLPSGGPSLNLGGPSQGGALPPTTSEGQVPSPRVSGVARHTPSSRLSLEGHRNEPSMFRRVTGDGLQSPAQQQQQQQVLPTSPHSHSGQLPSAVGSISRSAHQHMELPLPPAPSSTGRYRPGSDPLAQASNTGQEVLPAPNSRSIVTASGAQVAVSPGSLSSLIPAAASRLFSGGATAFETSLLARAASANMATVSSSPQVQGMELGMSGRQGCETLDSPAAHARVLARGTDGGGGLLSQATSISKAAAAAVADAASTALAPLQRTFNRNSYSAGPHLASEIAKLAAAAAAAEDAARAAAQVPAPVVDELERYLAESADAWTFDAFKLEELSGGHALSVLGYYLLHTTGLLEAHKIRGIKAARLMRTIESGYQPNPYHNKTHAADVLQTMHVLLLRSGMVGAYADPLTHLACLLAAAAHDLEHVGLTNDFLINIEDDLAVTYNDSSPMEQHHLASFWRLLRAPDLNILSGVPRASRQKLRKIMIDLVMATDMKQHVAITSRFSTVHRINATNPQTVAPLALQPSGASATLGQHQHRLTSGAATPPLTTSQQALPPSKDLQSHTSGSNALVSKLSGDASSGTASTVAPLGQFQHANRSHSKSGDGAHVVVPVGPPSHNQHQHSQQQQSASMGGSPGISGSTAGVPARDGTASVTSALPPNVMGPAGGPPSPRPTAPALAPIPLDEAERVLSLQIALKVADIGMIAESREVNIRWVACLEEEFFNQGDREKAAGIPVSPLMDRDKPGVSKSQPGFYDFVAIPMFRNFTTVFPGARPLMDYLMDNYRNWQLRLPAALGSQGSGAQGPGSTHLSGTTGGATAAGGHPSATSGHSQTAASGVGAPSSSGGAGGYLGSAASKGGAGTGGGATGVTISLSSASSLFTRTGSGKPVHMSGTLPPAAVQSQGSGTSAPSGPISAAVAGSSASGTGFAGRAGSSSTRLETIPASAALRTSNGSVTTGGGGAHAAAMPSLTSAANGAGMAGAAHARDSTGGGDC